MTSQLTVGIEGLVVECIIGITPAERTTPRPLLIDVRVKMRPSERHTNTVTAAAAAAKEQQQQEQQQKKKEEGDTKSGIVANHADLAARCRTMASDGQCALLDTLATRMGNQILADYAPDAVSVYVCLRKPRALRDAGVTVEYEVDA
ncbi:Dihydroneopterin aldolase [Pandoravirus quercus]|uniref:Dihydroneopterin aldolase n=1 Tax=Pandoravirus quercus TaxID=2107709 RepID=A0A2U7U7T6_9VIRU|nr:Dihydroneopterin aldolase [Pandoravirus quercus]AVK74491.1 Dihydroneopterin aldolase [Pandoravirus quercus]